jgi:hypothetical protein
MPLERGPQIVTGLMRGREKSAHCQRAEDVLRDDSEFDRQKAHIESRDVDDEWGFAKNVEGFRRRASDLKSSIPIFAAAIGPRY